MFYILAVIFMLFSITTLIICKAFRDSLIPLFLRSEHAAKFRARLSRAIFQLICDIKNDVFNHLETICEPDGDEPFEPYMDSPLRTCPPTDFVSSPPKEEVGAFTDENNNGTHGNNNPPRRRATRRRILVNAPPGVPAPVPAAAPPPQAHNPNPAVLVERIPPRQLIPLPNNLIAVERQIMEGENRNRVGPRRVLQLRGLEGLLSPPPQQNRNNNAFQFD